MPDWLVNVIVAIIAVSGGYVTAWGASRRSHRDDRQMLIDQLQEERKTYVDQLGKERAEQAAERVAYTRRLDAMWTDKAASREHVAALRDHIWQRKDPPPPDPPAGYIQ